jgi:hypothetical protein
LSFGSFNFLTIDGQKYILHLKTFIRHSEPAKGSPSAGSRVGGRRGPPLLL